VSGVLDGRVAVVTGAAAGIGRATARHLGELGARVAVTDIDGEGAVAVAEGMVADGLDAVGIACDVSSPAAIEAMVSGLADRFGGIDLLDHNAAWTSFGRDTDAEGVDLETWDRVLRTNTTGALVLTRCVVPRMRRRGGGAIVFISSGSAAIGERSRVAYGVSKAGIEQLTRHVAVRYGRQGIRCNAVAPGFIATGTAERGIPEAQRQLLADQNPMGRLGTADDIARVVGFLLSPAAGFVNGQVLAVDGGLSIAPRLPGGGPPP
jgi:NAD(P)-dependent dehydrogenase (short-subunit alcohol dehydrogenase family)